MKITLQDLLYSRKVHKGIILDWYHEPNPENLSLKKYVDNRQKESAIDRINRHIDSFDGEI